MIRLAWALNTHGTSIAQVGAAMALPSPRRAPSGTSRPVRRGKSQRGFTLLEMMAVLGVIAVCAALATPSFTEMIKERRNQQEAGMMADAFRTARARALGRGAAVSVLTLESPPTASIFERLTEAGATGMPLPSCRGAAEVCAASDCVGVPGCVVAVAGTPCWRKVVDVVGRPGASTLASSVINDSATGEVPATEVSACFSPRGRTFVSMTGGFGFAPLNGLIELQLVRADGTMAGASRSVFVLSNGQTRMAL